MAFSGKPSLKPWYIQDLLFCTSSTLWAGPSPVTLSDLFVWVFVCSPHQLKAPCEAGSGWARVPHGVHLAHRDTQEWSVSSFLFPLGYRRPPFMKPFKFWPKTKCIHKFWYLWFPSMRTPNWGTGSITYPFSHKLKYILKNGFGKRHTWPQTFTVSLASCVTLGKPLHLSEPLSFLFWKLLPIP